MLNCFGNDLGREARGKDFRPADILEGMSTGLPECGPLEQPAECPFPIPGPYCNTGLHGFLMDRLGLTWSRFPASALFVRRTPL